MPSITRRSIQKMYEDEFQHNNITYKKVYNGKSQQEELWNVEIKDEPNGKYNTTTYNHSKLIEQKNKDFDAHIELFNMHRSLIHTITYIKLQITFAYRIFKFMYSCPFLLFRDKDALCLKSRVRGIPIRFHCSFM